MPNDPGPAPPTGPFEKPSGELTGQAAFDHFSRYTVTGAAAHPDGSWAPGTAPPTPPNQNLGPLRYQQPTDCGA